MSFVDNWLADATPRAKVSRRAWAVVKYKPKDGEEKDITEELSKYLLSLSYTDNFSDAADDVELELEDRAQLWTEEWFPEMGAMLDITIHCYNWKNLAEGETYLPLGKYELDEIECQGMPSVVKLKAVSIIAEGTLRGTQKNRTWENISIWKCADDICKEHGLSLHWDCDENPNLDHIEQADQSDLEFLEKICKDNGKILKATPEQIIIVDELKYERQKPLYLIRRPGTIAPQEEQESQQDDLQLLDRVTGYSLKAKTRDVYYKCHVKYQKGEKKEVIEGEFTDPNKKSGKTLHCGDQVENKEEAERLAKKKLREVNKDELTGSFSLMGHYGLMAGIPLVLQNFGKFDGSYFITKAAHSLSGTYTTSIDVRRCLDGY